MASITEDRVKGLVLWLVTCATLGTLGTCVSAASLPEWAATRTSAVSTLAGASGESLETLSANGRTLLRARKLPKCGNGCGGLRREKFYGNCRVGNNKKRIKCCMKKKSGSQFAFFAAGPPPPPPTPAEFIDSFFPVDKEEELQEDPEAYDVLFVYDCVNLPYDLYYADEPAPIPGDPSMEVTDALPGVSTYGNVGVYGDIGNYGDLDGSYGPFGGYSAITGVYGLDIDDTGDCPVQVVACTSQEEGECRADVGGEVVGEEFDDLRPGEALPAPGDDEGVTVVVGRGGPDPDPVRPPPDRPPSGGDRERTRRPRRSRPPREPRVRRDRRDRRGRE